MDWQAYSLDLNPIEHVWDMLGRRIVARQPPPTYLPELRRALLDEWCNIPQDHIDNLILSMPKLYPEVGVMVWVPFFGSRIALDVIRGNLQYGACQTLSWPVRSLDLSPMEQLWDLMGNQMHLSGNANDLARQLEQILQKIHTAGEHHSMPRRVASCIQARVGSTQFRSR
ncbi:transposable element Tcb2 transposase [Trichonephila clavipes]|nr:transposable element Tcb2 transposase [Trichonephila clavipes]